MTVAGEWGKFGGARRSTSFDMGLALSIVKVNSAIWPDKPSKPVSEGWRQKSEERKMSHERALRDFGMMVQKISTERMTATWRHPLFITVGLLVLVGLHSSAPMPKLSVHLNQSEIEQTVFKSPTSHPPANLPAPNPTKSFWIDSAPDANPLATEGSKGTLTRDADVCIIGSGITGMQSFASCERRSVLDIRIRR
jgi:hypothetical protein